MHLPTLPTFSLGAPAAEPLADPPTDGTTPVPHVVAWNLTRRCNLACAHCYISAGSWHAASGELDTDDCLRIVDELLDVNPAPMLILSGGEPLLRDDLEAIAGRAAQGGATVVVGTNGTRLGDTRIESLMEAGVTGVAVSVDSLDPRYHDRFRNAAAGRAGIDADGRAHGSGALADTRAAVERCVSHGLDFVVQTTVTRANRAEIPDIAAWAADRGAVSFNVYFLVETGRGDGMKGLEPRENDEVLVGLVELERAYRGRMMVRSKCQPQIMRHVLEAGGTGPGSPAGESNASAAAPTPSDSPLLNYGTRCPCGVHYCRITPEGKVTPCPYTPAVAGDLTTHSFREVWERSPVFRGLRDGELEGKCGRCEYRRVCGGCRARAYADGRGLLGPDESCAYEPDGSVPVVEPAREITYGAPTERELEWTGEARARLERIPSFVRGVVAKRLESYARQNGRSRVDADLMTEVRRALPVDFSKRLPFFLRREDSDRSAPDRSASEDRA